MACRIDEDMARAMVVNRTETFWNIALAGLSVVVLLANPARSAVVTVDRDRSLSPRIPHTSQPVNEFTCPAALETLTATLLRDLPGYINRSNFRLTSRQTFGPTYAIIASQPDFTPLPTGSSEYPNTPDPHLHQIFFTVLERQYVGNRVTEFQQYHWLFLTQTPGGWRLALLFSRIGFYPSDQQPLTPPRDTSESRTADAIRLWLRNCEAGSVRP